MAKNAPSNAEKWATLPFSVNKPAREQRATGPAAEPEETVTTIVFGDHSGHAGYED